jgi:hypothetical protein
MRTLQAFDIDTDALADALERMADGIRGSGVMVEEVETGHRAVVEDVSTFTLRLRFAATEEYVDVVDAIEYDVGQDPDRPPVEPIREWVEEREHLFGNDPDADTIAELIADAIEAADLVEPIRDPDGRVVDEADGGDE